MISHHFHSLVFVGAQSDALPIGKYEPLMTANFPDDVLGHFGAQQPGRRTQITPAAFQIN
jgi:hypothetical protein